MRLRLAFLSFLFASLLVTCASARWSGPFVSEVLPDLVTVVWEHDDQWAFERESCYSVEAPSWIPEDVSTLTPDMMERVDQLDWKFRWEALTRSEIASRAMQCAEGVLTLYRLSYKKVTPDGEVTIRSPVTAFRSSLRHSTAPGVFLDADEAVSISAPKDWTCEMSEVTERWDAPSGEWVPLSSGPVLSHLKVHFGEVTPIRIRCPANGVISDAAVMSYPSFLFEDEHVTTVQAEAITSTFTSTESKDMSYPFDIQLRVGRTYQTFVKFMLPSMARAEDFLYMRLCVFAVELDYEKLGGPLSVFQHQEDGWSEHLTFTSSREVFVGEPKPMGKLEDYGLRMCVPFAINADRIQKEMKDALAGDPRPVTYSLGMESIGMAFSSTRGVAPPVLELAFDANAFATHTVRMEFDWPQHERVRCLSSGTLEFLFPNPFRHPDQELVVRGMVLAHGLWSYGRWTVQITARQPLPDTHVHPGPMLQERRVYASSDSSARTAVSLDDLSAKTLTSCFATTPEHTCESQWLGSPEYAQGMPAYPYDDASLRVQVTFQPLVYEQDSSLPLPSSAEGDGLCISSLSLLLFAQSKKVKAPDMHADDSPPAYEQQEDDGSAEECNVSELRSCAVSGTVITVPITTRATATPSTSTYWLKSGHTVVAGVVLPPVVEASKAKITVGHVPVSPVTDVDVASAMLDMNYTPPGSFGGDVYTVTICLRVPSALDLSLQCLASSPPGDRTWSCIDRMLTPMPLSASSAPQTLACGVASLHERHVYAVVASSAHREPHTQQNGGASFLSLQSLLFIALAVFALGVLVFVWRVMQRNKAVKSRFRDHDIRDEDDHDNFGRMSAEFESELRGALEDTPMYRGPDASPGRGMRRRTPLQTPDRYEPEHYEVSPGISPMPSPSASPV